MEQIYTIPVNEAFEECGEDNSKGCPFCRMYNKLEDNELDLILGASMMEPDVRIKTNALGFCDQHFRMMFARGKRLPLALMLESHLNDVSKNLDGNMSSLFIGKTADNAAKTIEKLDSTCYVCDRINSNFVHMVETAALLWQNDEKFREKADKIGHYCLPHYAMFIKCGRERLGKKEFPDFYKQVEGTETKYFDKLKEDVSWFCKKFDYRYEQEPWYDAKDAPERAKDFLTGTMHTNEEAANKPSGGLN